MSKTIYPDDREEDVIYIDAREFNKNKKGYDRGTGVCEYFEFFKKSNRKFAKNFRNYDENNIVTNKNLSVGDYMHNNVCVEVKEKKTGDLADSIRGKRLATQSHELYKLKDPELYAKPFKDTRIIVMCDGDDFEHISNSPDIYKGILNFSGETPVNYVNYTNKYTYGNPYEHLGDALVHLFGMNGSQIGRQSHVSMIRNQNPAITHLMSLDTLNSTECDRLCKSMGWHSWDKVNKLVINPMTGDVDYNYAFNVLKEHTSDKKAMMTLTKMTGKEVYELNLK